MSIEMNIENLYYVACSLIQKGDFEKFKEFHEITCYDFSMYDKNAQSLIAIAGSWCTNDENFKIFMYMLENGANLDELDYSEYWEDDYPEYSHLIKDGGIPARELIKMDVEYKPLMEVLEKY